ncbi:MAG: hypothetical protein ABIH65_01620 [Nanoarchaeota archaeon]
MKARKTKKKVNKKEIEELDRILKPEEELTFEKNIRLQYSESKKNKTGQYLVRIPKKFEELLKLERGKEIKLIVKIPPKHKDEKIKVYLEF